MKVRGQGKIERMKTKTEKQRSKKGQVSGSETEIVEEGIKAVGERELKERKGGARLCEA